MSNSIILLLLLVVVAVALTLFKKKAGKGPLDFPYQSKDVLYSPAERSFLGALDKILEKSYRVFAKVRLADIVDIQKGNMPVRSSGGVLTFPNASSSRRQSKQRSHSRDQTLILDQKDAINGNSRHFFI